MEMEEEDGLEVVDGALVTELGTWPNDVFWRDGRVQVQAPLEPFLEDLAHVWWGRMADAFGGGGGGRWCRQA